MSSYNRINGPYTQESRELLTTVLRDEWGYEGLVVSDWIGKRNTVAQVHAGNDLMMPGEPAQAREIVEAVRSGRLAEADVDRCVTRVLEYILRDAPFPETSRVGDSRLGSTCCRIASGGSGRHGFAPQRRRCFTTCRRM